MPIDGRPQEQVQREIDNEGKLTATSSFSVDEVER